MNTLSKVVATLLLVAMCMASLAVYALPPAASPHARSAGCHEKSEKAPAPEPVSYRCCRAGHGSALLQPSFAPGPILLRVSFAEFSSSSLVVASVTSSAPPLSLSGSPPVTLPFRI